MWVRPTATVWAHVRRRAGSPRRPPMRPFGGGCTPAECSEIMGACGSWTRSDRWGVQGGAPDRGLRGVLCRGVHGWETSATTAAAAVADTEGEVSAAYQVGQRSLTKQMFFSHLPEKRTFPAGFALTPASLPHRDRPATQRHGNRATSGGCSEQFAHSARRIRQFGYGRPNRRSALIGPLPCRTRGEILRADGPNPTASQSAPLPSP